MSETTQTSQPSRSTEEKPRRRFLRRAAIATIIAAVATGIGVRAFAQGGHFGWHRAGFMGAPLDPAQLDELLSHDPVDRAALEALRADQLKLAEQASRRFTQALADVADVLTPEQRKAL